MDTKSFIASDPTCWIGRGRTTEHAEMIAAAWRDYPDLPNDAPVELRMARTRERVIAMRPVTDAIARQTESERQARNFGFTQAKVSRGGGTRLDQAILIGRTYHGYDWNEAVEFANGWYAAQAGWDARGPVKPLVGCPDPRLVSAYHKGFREGGGDIDDLFDTARRANLAAHRTASEAPDRKGLSSRPRPSTWPQPSDAARPTPWSKRLVLMGAREAEEGLVDTIRQAPGAHQATIIKICPTRGFRKADDAAQAGSLGDLLRGREFEDILIAAQDQDLAAIDAHAGALPLCRTMERLRHTRLLQRAQLRTWIARGLQVGQVTGAGHIRWGKAINGLIGRLGEFTARYAGRAQPRGHRIVIEVDGARLATGYFDVQGQPLDPEAVISNRARLRAEMAALLRSFAASTRLPCIQPSLL